MTTGNDSVAAGGGDDGGDENKLIAERRAKLVALRSGNGEGGGTGAGGGAFPNDFRRDALAGQLLDSFGERPAEWLEANPTRVKVGGRLMFKRVMGKASFATVRDGSGQIQFFITPADVGQET